MFTAIMFYLFVVMGLINVMHFGFNIVGANIYDIKQNRQALKNKPKRRKKELVTILIPAHNEAKAIIRCLDSVRKSSYRKIEIIVIDDASTDTTRKLVRAYIYRYNYRNIRLMYRQKNGGKAAALNHALRNKSVKGDLVMTLDADSILHKQAIKTAVEYFQDPTVAGVATNVRIIDNFSVLGLLQKFEHMIGYRSKKFYTLTNSEFIVGGVGSIYRKEILKKVKFYDQDTVTEDIGLSLKVVSLGNKQNRIVYASDVVAMTEGVQTFSDLMKQRYRWKMGSMQNLIKNRTLLANASNKYSRILTFYRLPMAFFGEIMVLMEPSILLYIIYLSIHFHNPSLIIGAYLTITLYVLWNLWPDEHTSIRRKLKLTIYAPFMYFIFYIMNAVQFSAVVRCIFNFNQVLRKQNNTSHWDSPQRSGEQAQFS